MSAGELIISAVYRGTEIGRCTASETENTQITIGREPGNSIVIPSQYVGRVHCVLRFYNGVWYAQNQSRNGTYINGRQIDGFTPLRAGDRLSLLSGDKEISINFSQHSAVGGNTGNTYHTEKDDSNDLELLVFDGKNAVSRYRLERS